MTQQLRSLLLALVVLNLVFVQITGAVTTAWMAPLFVLASAAPLLWHLQRFRLYRATWNIGLLAIFALLVLDTQQSGLRYLLEDGLILAAFCQVHVLNNLDKQQKPDLIFFNSFLIALVTSFFCQDLVYSLVFVVYALFLMISISLSASSTVGWLPRRTLPRAELVALVRRSLRHGATAMGITVLVFTFWPRNFQREGLVQTDLVAAASTSQIGFTDNIPLDRKANTAKTNEIVMRVRVLQGHRDDIPSHWRGATFSNLQKRGWWADTNMQPVGYVSARQFDQPWERRRAGEFHREGRTTGAKVVIELHDADTSFLFAPLHVHRIQFDVPAFPQQDGNFRVSIRKGHRTRYFLDLDRIGANPPPWPGENLDDFKRLHPRVVPPETANLVAEIASLLPRGSADQRLFVETARSYLSQNRTYFLPGESGAAENLGDFLAGRGGGHCEYFATAMILLLRQRQIPCRMVGGYLAHEWNDEGTELVIRSRHAHAWVEVWDAEKGWSTIDPTPAREEFDREGSSIVARTREFFRNLWAAVTGFDATARDAALTWARERIADSGAFLGRHPIAFLAAMAGLFALYRWHRRRRRPPIDPEVETYLLVLGKLELELRRGETPRQLLARAQVMVMPDEELTRLARATERHERHRYLALSEPRQYQDSAGGPDPSREHLAAAAPRP